MYIVFEEIVQRILNPRFKGVPHFAQSNFISGIHTMDITFNAGTEDLSSGA